MGKRSRESLRKEIMKQAKKEVPEFEKLPKDLQFALCDVSAGFEMAAIKENERQVKIMENFMIASGYPQKDIAAMKRRAKC